MNLETLERALEAIAEAKREIILTRATDGNRRALDHAYAGLAKAESAIAKLIGFSEFGSRLDEKDYLAESFPNRLPMKT